MARTHSLAYQEIPGVRVCAVTSRDAGKATHLAENWNASVYHSLDEMLKCEQLDAVDICLPTSMHRQATERVAASGKHVICEKPIAATIEDAEAMIDACQAHGVKLMIAHSARFHPEILAARQELLGGSLGKPAMVRTSRISPYPDWSTWFEDYGDTGSLIDMAIHDFDLLRWCFGDVEQVFTRKAASNRKDHTLTILRFASGVIAHVEAGWSYPPGVPVQISLEIAGTRGVALFDRSNSQPLLIYGSGGRSDGLAETPLNNRQYVGELTHFVSCIRSGIEPLTSGHEGIEALRISLAAVQSMRTGLPVRIGGPL